MHRRRELLIGVLIGLSFMLLASLAAAIAPRSRMAYAQSNPWISISIGEDTLPQGGATYLVGGLNNMPQDPNDDGKFHPDLRYRFDLERNDEGTWNEANECEEPSFVGSDHYIGTWYRSPLDVGTGPVTGFTIPSNCPVGSYRILATAKYSPNTIIVTSTRELTVIHGPALEIEMSSDAFYRGATSDVTMEFSYLNNLQDGSNLSYRADVMKLVGESSFNFANDCEGTGLGNIDKSDETNNKNFNFENNPSGSIDDPDGDSSVEISGQIPATCPTGRYRLTVELWDSSKSELTSATQEFVVSTDPNATPSSKIELSPPSPVTPGTEIDAIITFYDLQNGANIRYRTDVTKRVNDADVVESSCHSSGIGLGQDTQSTVSRNPIIMSVTVSSSCPAGSYQLKSVISDTAKNEIVSASADFTIGNPDLTPSAPAVSNYTAQVGTPFSKQLPEGSGGDGSLSYSTSGRPAGLDFTASSRTIAGTPTASGTFTVRYTVTDSDGDSDYVDFTITVDPDLKPAAPSVSGFSAKVGTLFSEQLPVGSGGDGALSYSVTSLPAGLDFNDTSRTIFGVPTTAGTANVTYTVTDEDGDPASTGFTITVHPDLVPTAPTVPGYTARVGSPFSQQLPAGSGGDGTLTYSVTGLPAGLEFITTTRTISGTPTTAESPTAYYTVSDADGDQSFAQFTITVNPDLRPTLSSIADYGVTMDSPFNEGLMLRSS